MNGKYFLRHWLGIAGFLVLLGTTVVAFGFSGSAERSECPGQVTCPVTGEEVCKDRCPLNDPDRPDCPGRVECPLTGELTCRDQCPLEASVATADTSVPGSNLPPCCRGIE